MTRIKTSVRRAPTSPSRRWSTLVVADKAELLSEVAALAAADFDVQTAEGAAAGLLALACRDFDLLLVDQAMKPLSGLQLLARAQQCSPHTAALILADPADVGLVSQALTTALVDAYVLKPLRAEALLQTMRKAALRRHRRASPRGALRQLHLLAQDVARLEEDRRGVLRYALEMECLALTDPSPGCPTAVRSRRRRRKNSPAVPATRPRSPWG
jgi:DNA-binding NtrC family response regulator